MALAGAIVREDKEDTEAQEALEARQQAFDGLRDVYARLYAGLTGAVAMAVMRGEPSDDARKLRKFLGDQPPSRLSTAALGNIRQTVESADAFLDRFIPAADLTPMRDALRKARAEAEAAEVRHGKESIEATDARTALFAARDRSRDLYLSARDALSAALRIEGHLERLSLVLPAYDRLRRVPGRNGDAAEGSADTDAPGVTGDDDLLDLPEFDLAD